MIHPVIILAYFLLPADNNMRRTRVYAPANNERRFNNAPRARKANTIADVSLPGSNFFSLQAYVKTLQRI
jgi:hypothetical protein